ncbi:hypothetical protein [Halomicrobium salinisoli]|nr:hypothetical protein [Halomicrobium salinisoli]
MSQEIRAKRVSPDGRAGAERSEATREQTMSERSEDIDRAERE